MTQSQFGHLGNSEVQQMEGVAALLAQSPSSPGVAKTGTLYGLGVAQQTTANGTVLVGVGAGVVQGSLTAGASLLINDAAFTLDIFTANPMGGLPRYDIVVFDALTRSITAIIGSPNATPTDPTVPATSLPLARLRHAASDTAITTAQIDDLRTYTALAGAPIPVPTQAARDALTLFDGLQVYRLDLHQVETYSGSAWGIAGHQPAVSLQTTSNVGSIVGVALDLLSLTFTANGTSRYKISGFVPYITGTAGDVAYVSLVDNGTVIRGARVTISTAFPFIELWRSLVLTAGTHTIKMQAQRLTGTGTETAVASTSEPIELLVEQIA